MFLKVSQVRKVCTTGLDYKERVQALGWTEQEQRNLLLGLTRCALAWEIAIDFPCCNIEHDPISADTGEGNS